MRYFVGFMRTEITYKYTANSRDASSELMVTCKLQHTCKRHLTRSSSRERDQHTILYIAYLIVLHTDIPIRWCVQLKTRSKIWLISKANMINYTNSRAASPQFIATCIYMIWWPIFVSCHSEIINGNFTQRLLDFSLEASSLKLRGNQQIYAAWS